MDLFENVMLLFQNDGWKMIVMWIIGVVAILNWHGKSMDDRKNKKQ